MSRRQGSSTKKHPKKPYRPNRSLPPHVTEKEELFESTMQQVTMAPIEEEEAILDFEAAKEMTVGEAVKKGEEIEVGITEDDGLLDKYIKRHRDEIASKKYVSQKSNSGNTETAVTSTSSKTTAPVKLRATQAPVVTPAPTQAVTVAPTKVPLVMDEIPTVAATSAPEEERVIPIVAPSRATKKVENDRSPSSKKKAVFWTTVGVLSFALLVLAAMLTNNHRQAASTTANKSSMSSTSTSSSLSTILSASSSEEDESKKSEELKAFDKAYAAFFTDKDLDTLKNSQFSKIKDLKKTLDKLTDKAEKETATEKYDRLVVAIDAIKDINSQFNKALIVDGELDTTAQVKDSAEFQAVTTGISKVDTLLASAINFGRSQLEVLGSVAEAEVASSEKEVEIAKPSSSPSKVSSAKETTTSTSTTTSSSAAVTTNPGTIDITEQRSLSRVPYNQTAIDDSTNSAWTFNAGVLENIVATSQQRGYFTGNNYYVERVNIINGNGYYNMFKSDGTYLFSINCKTGYFFGNGSGRAADY